MLLDFEFEAVNQEHVSSSSSSQCSRPVRICSWNILAAAYANCKVFPDVEPSVIAWPRRRPLIAAALERLNADVLCLQEVDRPFEELGLEQDYDYVRAQRPDMRADGCIIAWRKRDFNILHKEEISFDDYLPEVADESDVEATQRFRRGNCAVLARLQPIGERPFVVATAHLCWEAGCEDVRQLQAEVLLKKLEPHSTKLGHRAVLCGDLNAVPGCVSHGIITRSLPSVYSDLEAVGAVTNSNATATSAVIVSENGHQAGGNADASKAAGFAAMLDYICLDARSAVACSPLRLPDRDELRDNLGGSDGPLPTLLCKSWPSDHLPVAADVIFTMNWQ
jgi:endonuclease/exonuclease/phosphatase family metal-dependent hydrolase